MAEEETQVEAAPTPPTLAEVEALLATREKDAETLMAQLGKMAQQRHDGTLPKEEYFTFFYYEDQLRVTLQQIERLQPRLAFARAEAHVTAAQAHHDGLCEAVTEAGMAVCHRWQDFLQACAQLAQLIDHQIDPLIMLVRPDGQPAFELPGGRETLQNMLTTFPNQMGLPQTVLPFLRDQLTVGQAEHICDHIKGRGPLAHNVVDRYLALYAVPEDKPDIPVED